MSDTFKYFQDNFQKILSDPSFHEPVSDRILKPIAYYKKLDMILVLYETNNENEYCAHSSQGTGFPDNINPPNFGFTTASSYHDALVWLADRYDEIRKNKYKV